MALIKLGIALAEIRGSVGGTTFARNRAGAYARNRTKPVNPSSARQTTIRTYLSQLQQEWQDTLTGPERAAWNAVAQANPFKNKLGEASAISGFNLYLRVNGTLLLGAQPILSVPPTPPLELPSRGFTIEAVSATGLAVTARDTYWGINDAVNIQITGAMSPGRNFWKGPYVNLLHFTNDTVLPKVLDATVAIGDRYHYRAVSYDAAQGTISTPHYGFVDCTT